MATATLSQNVTQFIDEVVTDITVSVASGNDLWMVLCGALVFFMHAGFAMLEAGSITKTSVANIMFKNITTVSIGVISYWMLGYAFAYERENDGDGSTTFIGSGDFAGQLQKNEKALWFFQMVFAATAATIVSGAVAGRIKLSAYFIVATCLTAFVYPVVSHWIWDNGGWLSAFTDVERLFNFDEGDRRPCGVIDFAGSGVVHMTGGVAAFWGAKILGVRNGWEPGEDNLPGHNEALTTLGTFILWFGWFGFNPGSTLAWDGALAGKVAVTTTVAPGAACLTGILISVLVHRQWDLAMVLNSVLGGLVSITAPCATVNPSMAVIIGILAAIVYYGASKLNRFVFYLDDPVDAAAVHGYCGFFGLICAGLFSDEDLIFSTYGGRECDTGIGDLLEYQFLAAICIFVWVSLFSILIFGALKLTNQLRLSEEEEYDVDMTEHGATAYEKMD